MPLMSFSDQKHVPMIIDGRKQQTTRKPRKNPITVKNTLHCYFKSRINKGTCYNCINQECEKLNLFNKMVEKDLPLCPEWVNAFGKAKVTAVVRIGRTTPSFDKWYDHEKEEWAVADGFDDFHGADEWFKRVHGPDWMSKDWDIIYFEGEWLKEAKQWKEQ